MQRAQGEGLRAKGKLGRFNYSELGAGNLGIPKNNGDCWHFFYSLK
jgi:hypothetical protein